MFAQRGFDGTPLQEIADAVGVAKPSLLYHFPSKDVLRQAVLEATLARWNEVLPRLLLAATSGEGQFHAVVEEVVRFFEADPDQARLLLRELLDRPNEVVGLIRTHVAPWVEVVAQHIRKGAEKGKIHPDVDPEAYVAHTIGLVLCGFATYEAFRELMPRDRHIAELLRIAKSSLFRSPYSQANEEG